MYVVHVNIARMLWCRLTWSILEESVAIVLYVGLEVERVDDGV